MVKIKKSVSSAPKDSERSGALSPEVSGKDGVDSASVPYERDQLEKLPASPVPVSGASPSAKPELPDETSLRSSSEAVSAVPELPEEFGTSQKYPIVPDSSSLKEAWKTCLSGPVAKEAMDVLEPHYESLSVVYDELLEDREVLRLRALQLEQAALTPRAVGSFTVLKGREAYEVDAALHQERVEECTKDVEEFGLAFLPTVLTMSPRVNRIKNEIIAKLNVSPTLESPDTTFGAVYSRYICSYGDEAGKESGFDKKMNQLEYRVECQKYKRGRMKAKRFEYAKILRETMDMETLGKMLADLKAMEHEYGDYADEHRALSHSAEEFMDKIGLAAQEKDAIIALRKKVNARKLGASVKLAKLEALRPPTRRFELPYRNIKEQIGEVALARKGIHEVWRGLRDLYTDNLETYKHLQGARHRLAEDIESADSINAVDEIEGRIQALNNNCDLYIQDAARLAAEATRFIGIVKTEREEYQRLWISKRIVDVKDYFRHSPEFETPYDWISETKERVLKSRSQQPRLIAAHNDLEEEYFTLCKGILTIQGLESSINKALREEPSESTTRQLERDVHRHRRLVTAHNARLIGYKYQSKGLLKLLSSTGATSTSTTESQPVLKPAATRLLDIARGYSEPLFMVVQSGNVCTDGKGDLDITVEDRIAVLKRLLEEPSSLDVHATKRSGDNLVHKVVNNSAISEFGKIEILRFLIAEGVGLNEYDKDNRYALDTLMVSGRRAPDLIAFLRGKGAILSPVKNLPIAAHLIGTGGSVSTQCRTGPVNVDLEGLSPRVTEIFLDPEIKEIIAEQCYEADPEMKPYLELVYGMYNDVRSYRTFIDRLRLARSSKQSERQAPVMISTGWNKPSGHAVGFVFNQESDGSYLYACNAGSKSDPGMSIVKYEVTDFDKAIGFFKTCKQDENTTLLFFTGDPASYGFQRCERTNQIPKEFNKGFQKRGNCPMASRKACLLAALWSTSRDSGTDPKKVRTAYKGITTNFRGLGVNMVLEQGLRELEGKALVSMLSKYDRPPCQELAHRLVDEILENASGVRAGRRHVSASNVTDPIERLALALEATKQDLGSMTVKDGVSLALHARRKGHQKAFELLNELTS